MKLNPYFQKPRPAYLFSEVNRQVQAYQRRHPGAEPISLGIGDVTRPLAPAVVREMQKAAGELGRTESFHGYGPEQGYPFLREAIAGYYKKRGVPGISAEEIFVSDGAKPELGNILELFDKNNTAAVPDPVYPVYADTNRMAGREPVFLDANPENNFLPLPDKTLRADIVYLCSPNNPTGAVYTRAGLQTWVNWALETQAVLLFDAAYERFITTPGLPRSIYELEGAAQCAIEFCSFSKMAGFTGVRCGWTVVPQALKREGVPLRELWIRRQATKSNGVSFIVQRGAAAVFTPKGEAETQEALDTYQTNARLLAGALEELGVFHTGGENSPYLWLRCPGEMDSWSFFRYLLEEAQVIGTPGAGFGKNGENFFRLTAFSSLEDTARAIRRLKKVF